MITQPQPIPPHLVNRDLKRELRFICPGITDKLRGVRVQRLTGTKSHLYRINNTVVSLDDAAELISGLRPLPSQLDGLPMFTTIVYAAPKPKVRQHKQPKPCPVRKSKPLSDLPLFRGMEAA